MGGAQTFSLFAITRSNPKSVPRLSSASSSIIRIYGQQGRKAEGTCGSATETLAVGDRISACPILLPARNISKPPLFSILFSFKAIELIRSRLTAATPTQLINRLYFRTYRHSLDCPLDHGRRSSSLRKYCTFLILYLGSVLLQEMKLRGLMIVLCYILYILVHVLVTVVRFYWC